MVSLPDDLNDALESALARFSVNDMTQATRRLIQQYREGFDSADIVLGSEIDVAAYAAYRMPATYAAVHTALRHTAALAPTFAPQTHIDVGGGTGAAVWAAAEIWPSLKEVKVLEQAPMAAALGGRLARQAVSPVVRTATWSRATIGNKVLKGPSDLVTMSYVLGELPPAVRDGVVRSLAADTSMVVLIEPGTPAGYERIIAARDVLIGEGLSVVAPCPHDGACPIPRGKDWCHFSVRLNRSSLHRQIKTGMLGFEDEKYSYVAASTQAWPDRPDRVIRHPQKRKGLVSLQLCTRDDGLTDEIVSKRNSDAYRRARNISWGDAWDSPREDGDRGQGPEA
ncbi:small ribosomal subunit Rsm22 family protein [Streptosporangium sp. KLBMP 9127]|nr:small ribosomal subunit Rsm22 family protein [Streptosporangium sp. KLBMP 9127]